MFQHNVYIAFFLIEKNVSILNLNLFLGAYEVSLRSLIVYKVTSSVILSVFLELCTLYICTAFCSCVNVVKYWLKSRNFHIRFCIRLFSELPLPSEEGYKHCDSCNHFVSSTNQHCTACNKCTSKVNQWPGSGRIGTHLGPWIRSPNADLDPGV